MRLIGAEVSNDVGGQPVSDTALQSLRVYRKLLVSLRVVQWKAEHEVNSTFGRRNIHAGGRLAGKGPLSSMCVMLMSHRVR